MPAATLKADTAATAPVLTALESVAWVAAVLTVAATAMLPVVPRSAWLICRPVTSLVKFAPVEPEAAAVVKARLPFSRFWPWNVVVCEMRSMAFSAESICDWLAEICPAVIVPVWAACVTRPWIVFSRVLTWPKALSAVEII